MTTSNDRLDRIEALVEANARAIESNTEAIEANAEAVDRLSAQFDRVRDDLTRVDVKISRLATDNESGRKWEDRTWDVVKWAGGISAGLSISAAIAVVGLLVKLLVEGK